MAEISNRRVEMKLTRTHLEPNHEKVSKTSGATVSITSLELNRQITDVDVSARDGAMTINIADVTNSQYGDTVRIRLQGTGSGTTVTFGTNFIVNSTAVVAASKQALVWFEFTGTKYVEVSRFIQS